MGGASAQNVQPAQASPADSFVDSIGVGTHLTYSNTLYYQAWPQVLSDLQQLGVRHIRDGYFNPSWSQFVAEHQQLAQSGIKTDYVIPFDPSITPQSIQQLAWETGDMDMIESPNECDIAGGCGGSSQWDSINNMLSFLPRLKAAGSALGVPVLGPSWAAYESFAMVGSAPAANVDDSNLHVYFGGRYPGINGWGSPDAQGNAYGSFQFWRDMGNLNAPGKPAVITETGYLSFPGKAQPFTIPLSVEESYIPRTFLLAYMHGIRRTYEYELVEDPNSPGYGLIDSNLNERPAFLAIQNLIANLADPGPGFTPGTLPMAIQGGDSTLQHLLLEKRDGSFWLILWLEQSSYDTVNQVPTPVTPQNVTVQLGGGYVAPNVGRFDPSGNLTWSSPNPVGSTVNLSVSDQLTIVKILQ